MQWLWLCLFVGLTWAGGAWFARALARVANSGRGQLGRLLASGHRVQGRLLVVEGGTLAAEVDAVRVYRLPIELELQWQDTPTRVRSALLVPETQLPRVQAGAPCAVVVEPNELSTLCVVELENAFGVRTAVTLGSMHSRW